MIPQFGTCSPVLILPLPCLAAPGGGQDRVLPGGDLRALLAAPAPQPHPQEDDLRPDGPQPLRAAQVEPPAGDTGPAAPVGPAQALPGLHQAGGAAFHLLLSVIACPDGHHPRDGHREGGGTPEGLN